VIFIDKRHVIVLTLVIFIGSLGESWAAKKINSARVGACVVKNLTQNIGEPVTQADAGRVWNVSSMGSVKEDLKYIVQNQKALDQALQQSEAKAIEIGAPPVEWGGGRFAFSHYIEGLPAAVKQNFVLDYLKKNGETPGIAAHMIEGLEPEEGIREAVVKYLSESGFLGDVKEKETFTDE
jgi:hypothetical protein